MTEYKVATQAQRIDTAEDAASICQAIREQKPTSITLSGNTHSKQAAEEIGKAIGECQDLESLNLADCFTTRLKDEVPFSIGLFLKDVYALPKFSTLDLSDNAVGAPGTHQLKQLLGLPHFRVLFLNNCGLGPDGARELATFFKELTEASSSAASSSPEVDALVAAVEALSISKAGVHLEQLHVGRNRMKDEGAEELAKGIPFLKELKVFTCISNSIKAAGLVALSHALKSCPNLEKIDFGDNFLKKEGSKALEELLDVQQHLTALRIADCCIEDAGASLIRKIVGNTELAGRLEELDLSFDDLESECAEIIADALAKFSSLKSLNLNGNCFSADAIKKLKSSLKELNRLEILQSLEDNQDEDEDDDADGDDDDD